MQLRVMADRMLVETFVGSGRAVVSTPVLAPGADPTKAGLLVLAEGTALTINAAAAWDMGCVWTQYP